MALQLLNAVTTNTTGRAIQMPPLTVQKSYNFVVSSSNFGSGTVQLQISQDGLTNWITPTYSGTALSITANGTWSVPILNGGLYVRAVLSGATSPSPVTAALY